MNEIDTAEERGVRVTKYLDVGDSGEVQVGFQIDSERSEPVTVRVTDPITADRDVHVPEADPNRWTASERDVEYERTLQPEETVTTAYRFVSESPVDIDGDQPAPSLAVDAASEPDGETVTGDERTAVAFDGTDREREAGAQPAAEGSGEFAMPDDEIPIAELTDGESESERTDDPPAGRAPTPTAARSAGDRSDDPVEALIRTLNGDASSEQRERLREALADATGPRSSLEAQVTRLQSRFEEFAAYVDALEAFLDENGAAEELLTDLSDRLERVQTDLERLRDDHADVAARLEDLETRFDEFRADVDDRQTAVEADVRVLEDDLERVSEEQREIGERLADLAEFRESVHEAFQGQVDRSTGTPADTE